MIDVLFLMFNDNANTGWRFFKCAQMLGMETMGFKGNTHPFYYPEQLPLFHEIFGVNSNSHIIELPAGNELDIFIQNSKIIHFMGSNCIYTGTDLASKNVVMQHGGRAYRRDHELLNTAYNEFCDAAIVQMPDLLGLGAKNERLIYFPVDTDYIQPSFKKAEPEDKLVIGYFASQPLEKGENNVINAIGKLSNLRDKFEFRRSYNGANLIWLEGLKRVRDCDLIIDVFSDRTVDGLEYGEWGNAAFEAAALGKIVLTMSLNFDVYLKEYGECALHITNTEDELLEALTRFIEMPHAELLKEKERTRAWVEKKHSLEATSERLWPVYEEIIH